LGGQLSKMLGLGQHCACQLIVALALACAHSSDPTTDSLAQPVRGFQSCALSQPASEVSHPWAGVAIDPEADPSTPGFAQLIRFYLDPSGRTGRVTIVRMSDPSSGDSLFRGERRVWIVGVDTDHYQGGAISYSYSDPSRSDDLWVYRPTERAVTRSTLPPFDSATPLQRGCDVLQRTFPGDRVTFNERSSGFVHSSGKLLRFLTHRVFPQPDRLIRGR
jgi:hypothetical protein